MDTSQGIDRGQREHHGKRRRHHRTASREHRPRRRAVAFVLRYWSKYWLETTAVLMFAAGVFLLLERFHIKAAVYRTVMGMVTEIRGLADHLWGDTSSYFDKFETSDLVGMFFILAACVLALSGLRVRGIARSRPTIDGSPCPKCGGSIRRSHHKSVGQRLLQMILRIRVRPYVCRKCSFRHSVWEHRRH